MIHRKRQRDLLCRFLIGVLLYAQFVVAAHACPGPAAMASAMQHGFAMQQEPGDSSAMAPACESMMASAEPGSANLCAEHCRQGQQSADTASAPVVNLGIPTFLYSLPLEPQHSLGSGRSFPAPDASLVAAPEPPHAILHCVFRI